MLSEVKEIRKWLGEQLGKMYAFWYTEMEGGIWRMSIKWWPDLIENKNQTCQKERKQTWRPSDVHAGCFHIGLEDTRTPWNWYSSSHQEASSKANSSSNPHFFQVRAVSFRENTLCFSKTIAIENGPVWIWRFVLFHLNRDFNCYVRSHKGNPYQTWSGRPSSSVETQQPGPF